MSCNQREWAKFKLLFKNFFNINLPIYLVPFIIFKLKNLIKDPVATVSKLGINIFRSVMFMTTFVLIIVHGSDRFKYLPILRNMNHYQQGFVTHTLSTMSIVFEQPHRRVDIIYFLIPRTVRVLFNLFKHRNFRFAKEFKGFHALVFAIAMGIVAFTFSEEMVVRKKIEQE